MNSYLRTEPESLALMEKGVTYFPGLLVALWESSNPVAAISRVFGLRAILWPSRYFKPRRVEIPADSVRYSWKDQKQTKSAEDVQYAVLTLGRDGLSYTIPGVLQHTLTWYGMWTIIQRGA